MSGYQELANAIIVQAAKDYRAALRKEPYNERAKKAITELERFFHSRWYGMLTDVDPDYLINRLRKEMGA